MALKLDNIRLSYKFFIITVVPVLMLGALAARVVHDDLNRLATDRTELSGIQPALHLLRVIQLTQQHLSVSVVEQVGDSGLRTAREGIAKDVEAGLQTSSDSAGRLGLASADERFTAIRKAWEPVSPAASPESMVGDKLLSVHAELLSREAETLEDIADSSALTLDPQTANYHLVRTAFFQLPALTDALSNSRAVAAGALTRGHLADAERVTLEGLRQVANGSLAAISRSLQRAAEDSPAHQSRLQALEVRITSEASGILKLISEQVLDAAMLTHPSQQFLVESTKAVDSQFVAMSELSEMVSSNIEARAASVHRELALVLLAVAFGVLFSTTLALIVARRTSGSLRRAVNLAKAVAAGDLTSNIESRSSDEIGELLAALNGMNQSLATVVSTVRNGSDSVATGSSQIASGNADLSQRTEEQASSLQQTVASLAQLTATIRANAQSAQQSGAISSAAFESANDGAAKVSRVSELMQEIRATSQKMADITGAIDSIAFQTNILALNASVEAARAGEQGRGFAVVASEVRGLAQRSAAAAREIASLITHNSEQVQMGADLAVTAGASMLAIVKSIKEVAALAKDIGDASTQQAQGLVQVNAAMEQLDTVTQQNAALVEQSTAAAESLKVQAGKLAQAVRQFNVQLESDAQLTSLVLLHSES